MKKEKLVLILLGLSVGVLIGSLSFLQFEHKLHGFTYLTWLMMWSAIFGIATPLTKGRIVSLLLIRFDYGTKLEKSEKIDYSFLGSSLVILGIFLAASKYFVEIFKDKDGILLYSLIFSYLFLTVMTFLHLSKIRPLIIIPIGLLSMIGGYAVYYQNF